MAYDLEDITTVAHLQKLSNRTKAELDLTIRTVRVADGTIYFYTQKNATSSDTPAFHVDFPTESFLNQAETRLVTNFAFSDAAYPGATDPNLNGKTVMVLAVKDDAKGTENDTVNYSFVDLTELIEIVEIASGDSSKILTITTNGKTRTISVNISADAGNILEVKNDGIYATNRVAGAVEGNILVFDANGAPSDSGKTFATNAEVDEMITSVFGATV